MIKVLLVDDHVLLAEALISMFKPEDGIEITHHVTNGHEVVSILHEIQVDVILMDISMPIIDGISTMELIKSSGITTPILMLTMHQSFTLIRKSLEKGAHGYILKDACKHELTQAINITNQRKNYFHPKINDQIFDYLRGKKKPASVVAELSTREIEVIQCLAFGNTSKDIATKLYISEHTVRTHRRNIMHKLNVKTSAELIHLASEKGIIC